MDIGDYQLEARETDVAKHPLIALLGLAGEIGSLFAVYKKRLRDSPPKEQVKAELSEELGDLLWYISTLASQNNIDLNDVVAANLQKTKEFFGAANAPYFDFEYPEGERLPQNMRVDFTLTDQGRVQMKNEDGMLGDSLSNNSHIEDNYKFHDAFHLSFMAHLHWSPNMRRLLRRKRKSSPATDENEDGARACAVEEAVAALAFAYARDASFFPRIEMVPLQLVSLLMKMTSNFEVSKCTSASWRKAIHDGARAFDHLARNAGGTIHIDLRNSTLIME